MIKLKQGSIRKRPDGLYEIRFRKNNERISVYSRTQKEVYNKFQIKLKDKTIIKKSSTNRKTQTFNSWLLIWIKEYKESKVSANTLRTMYSTIKNHISEQFKNLFLNKINPIDIQRLLNTIQSGRMQLETYDIINESLRQAYYNKLIKENPAQFIERPSYVKKKGKPLTKEEVTYILAEAKGKKYEYPIRFLLGSGCHPQALNRLLWEDIDLDNKAIFIRETKNRYTIRNIPLFPHLEEVFRNIEKTSENVFNVSQNELSKWFHDKLPNHCLRECRQTFGTHVRQLGVDMKVIQEWLGHSTYEQTANTYSQVIDTFALQEAKKVNFDW